MNKNGAMIISILPDSPASKADLMEYDVIIKIDNKEIEEDIEDLKITINDLSALIQKNEDELNDSRGKIKVAETNKQNIVDTIMFLW